jgi:hypothetical protein
VQLTQVKALVGGTGQRKVLLGCLRNDGAGELHIEDASGSVPLLMDKANSSGIKGFLTEGMCMLVEGKLLPNGKFEALTIADPPIESTSLARESLQGFSLSGARPLSCALHFSFSDVSSACCYAQSLFVGRCIMQP